jgi:predicted nucleotidyltransferase
MNYHTEEWFDAQLQRHLEEAKKFNYNIFGLYYQGSGNYGLDYKGSDFDSVCIIIPSLSDIIRNSKPVSFTHIMENDEHINFMDIRHWFELLKKQNIQFLELLWSVCFYQNSKYTNEWSHLTSQRETIARLDRAKHIKAIKGVALEKYHALCKPFPSKLEILEKFGYDPKQLHHLMRLYDFLRDYISGNSYQSCLWVENPSLLVSVKEGRYKERYAKQIAEFTITNINALAASEIENNKKEPNIELEKWLDNLIYDILYKSIYEETHN